MKERDYEIARNRNYDGYQRALASMIPKFFVKKAGLRASINEQLAEQFHKPVTTKFKRGKVYARLKDNIAEMRSLSSKNRNVKYFLCVVDIFIKYAWVKPLKDKKGKTVLKAFIEIVNESYLKSNKL